MMTLNVLAREPDELVVVGTLEVMPARAIDRTHVYSFRFLKAFTVVPRAPYFSALRRVSSKADRA
jgi:hypothetical protein